jgi:hypothetical protein
VQFGRRTEASAQARLLRPDYAVVDVTGGVNLAFESHLFSNGSGNQADPNQEIGGRVSAFSDEDFLLLL